MEKTAGVLKVRREICKQEAVQKTAGGETEIWKEIVTRSL
jgi:hypothetical protein